MGSVVLLAVPFGMGKEKRQAKPDVCGTIRDGGEAANQTIRDHQQRRPALAYAD